MILPSEIEIADLKAEFGRLIREHEHDGIQSTQIKVLNLFGETPREIQTISATIATTGNTDTYVIAPFTGRLAEVDFSGVDALATSDTNYITWTITNLGQAGSGTTAMLMTTPAGVNTTKATGGTAISANTVRALVIDLTAHQVTKGDRLLIRAAVTNTLANTVTFPTYLLRFK